MGHKEEIAKGNVNVFRITKSQNSKCLESYEIRKETDTEKAKQFCEVVGEHDENQIDSRTWLKKIRQSSNTATFLMFIIMFLDGLLLTSLGMHNN